MIFIKKYLRSCLLLSICVSSISISYGQFDFSYEKINICNTEPLEFFFTFDDTQAAAVGDKENRIEKSSAMPRTVRRSSTVVTVCTRISIDFDRISADNVDIPIEIEHVFGSVYVLKMPPVYDIPYYNEDAIRAENILILLGSDDSEATSAQVAIEIVDCGNEMCQGFTLIDQFDFILPDNECDEITFTLSDSEGIDAFYIGNMVISEDDLEDISMDLTNPSGNTISIDVNDISPNGYYYDPDLDPVFFSNSVGTWVLEICDLVSDGHEISISNLDMFFCSESYSCDSENIILDEILIQSNYVAEKSIEITDASQLTERLILQAGEEINLNENFEVPINKSLEAHIDDCTALGTSCRNSLGIYFDLNSPELTGRYEHVVNTINEGNGCHNCSGGAQHAQWFSFVVPEDLFFSVNSCFDDGDQRLWIYEGSCDDLNQIAASDDDCGLNVNINQLLLNKGDTIYLEWDDRWDDDSFIFDIEYFRGSFDCDDITISDNGSYLTIPQVAGCVNCSGGDNIRSIWYRYDVVTNGFISINSCGNGVDTRLWVYSRVPGGSLTQIAASDDDCDRGDGLPWASEVIELCVEEGETIFFEWDDRWINAAFEFDFTFTPSSCSR